MMKKIKVFLLKNSEWQAMRWDSQGPVSTVTLQPENIFTVEAATHHEAYRQAYQQRHGVNPPEEKVQILPDSRIVGGTVTFYLDDDDYPIPGKPGNPWAGMQSE
ncbi:MAG: hypothetical protein ACYC6A_12070 [Armatimonadota bacterium]